MVVKPPHQPLSDKRAYVDLGVLELLTVVVDGKRQALAYSGRPALADWWYLSRRINRLKSVATKTNGRKSTKRIRVLFKRRTLRFRQHVNTAVRRAIERLWQEGVSEIVVGDLKDIRASVNGGRKSNTMVHNFWSLEHRCRPQRRTRKLGDGAPIGGSSMSFQESPEFIRIRGECQVSP